ncbi:MAG TPA: hypothetical protein VNC62_15805 [Burkholderiales bacterium]|nr:hypothetical protein [Burkholderiales bacterium]
MPTQADAAAWSIDLSLRRIRDCGALASIMKCADTAERRWLGRQLANVLAALPAAQAELSANSQRVHMTQLSEFVRQVGMLETVVLELARERCTEGL